MYTHTKFLNVSVDEYLQFELESRIRHEYLAGQVYPMREDSEQCKVIISNMLTRLRTHLFGTDYRTYSSEMKIRIDDLDIFYYPNISVTCNPQDREKFYKYQPCLIVEVFSSATERIYRNEKLMNYRRLNSLQEYVLVCESEIQVEVYHKNRQNKWFVEELEAEDHLKLASVDLEIAIADIYEDVKM
ncbi:MAG: Uma2 family endonuclease [Hapalosiphonaceae cyanobacterium JJU2]|nr:MAG: Uma2 family endonuclease [Hapalosiphonaceae cyanobacterium JJU2]